MAGGKITKIASGGSSAVIEGNHTGFYDQLSMSAGSKNAFQAGVTNHGNPEEPKYKTGHFVKGWWSSDQEGSQKITESLYGETVYFHIETRNIPDGQLIGTSLYDDDVKRSAEEADGNGGSDAIEVGTEGGSTFQVLNYRPVHQNKVVIGLKLGGIISSMIEAEEDKTIELFFACSHEDQNVELPISFSDYLNVSLKTMVLFIGGAGDKRPYLGSGPNYNIRYAKNPFDKLIGASKSYASLYLGFYEAYPEADIESVIEPQISKNELIYIVGHSLGGWNAAHLSQILTDKGYMVEMLITLDPVGSDLIVNSTSEIYFRTPSPKSKFWINIFVDPKDYSFPDFIADMGVQWIPKNPVPDISHITQESHHNADFIFTDKTANGKSASDLLYEAIKKKIK